MEQPTPQALFPGFEYANSELGFTQVGNANFALLAQIDNLSEMKVTLYLIRNTWGYQEYEQGKLITTEEFVNGRKRKDDTRLDSGCGLKTTAVKEGLARGIEHGHIVCNVDDSDKGRIRKYYRLKMDETSKPVIAELDSRNATMPSRKATMDSRNATIREPQRDHRSEKETLETHLKKQTKEEESASLSPLHPMWSLWMASIRRPAKKAPIERDLNYCQELEEMCKSAQVELTIELIHKVRDQFKQANTDKKGWFLGNLVTELREYLDQIQPAQPEMPELTEEERDEKVLWTEKPSAARRLFARGATMQEHLEDSYCKPHWMPRSAAREYDYDMPGEQHYSPAQQAEYEQLTSLPELARAG
jgi:hypothetical protein